MKSRPSMSNGFRQIVAAGMLLAALASPAQASDPQPLEAGAYAMDITPRKFPISANGGMRDNTATSAHEPLHARCLVLSDGTTKLAIVVCDSCMIPRDVMDRAKEAAAKTGIPADRILISATHAHSCPTVTGVFQSDPDEDYRTFLAERIAEGIREADARRQPARVGWGVAREPNQVFNRRWYMKPGTKNVDPFGGETDRVRMNPGQGNPANDRTSGPTDPEVCFLSVQTRDGKPLAFLANYSLHYVGGVPGGMLSDDYFGEFARRIGQRLGATGEGNPFVGIMSNGTSGNINNVDFSLDKPTRREPFEQISRVATSVAAAAYEEFQKIEHRDRVMLDMKEREIELGVRLPSEYDVAKAKELLAGATAPYSKPAEIYARETLLLKEYPKTVKAKIQAIRIGSLGIATTPCETFVETGLAVKKESPLKPTFVIELANGYNGYLPTPEHHELGGYETWRARSSYLSTDSEPKIRATMIELLKEVAQSSDSK